MNIHIHLDQTNTMTTFEILYNQTAPGIKVNFNRLKHRPKIFCYQYIFTNKDNISTLSKGELLAFKQLSTNNSIVITKPDKGNGVVTMNHSDYLSKLLGIVSDSTKFKLLTEDPTEQ